MLDVSTQTLYRWSKRLDFPQPSRIGGRKFSGTVGPSSSGWTSASTIPSGK